jgi:hypothetical protein
MKEKDVKQVLLESWYQWERGEHKDGVEEGKYGGHIMYLCIKMEK